MHNIDDKSINLLRNLDHISLGELSPPSSYDFIRYSRDPLLDTQEQNSRLSKMSRQEEKPLE